MSIQANPEIEALEQRVLGDVTTLADAGIVETIREQARSSQAEQLV